MIVSDKIKQETKKWFNFYEDKIIPVVKSIPEVTQSDYGFHGFYTHTDSVVFRGIYYALCLGKDPAPVIFACVCHDIARTDDEYNEIHGEMALPVLEKLMSQFSGVLTNSQKNNIIYAVKNHTIGMEAPDYISACLWDADRTRLGWVYGYKEKFMSTEIAKRIASGSPVDFLKFQNECLGRDLLEDREGVLEYAKCEVIAS